jgi:hypothetical protein
MKKDLPQSGQEFYDLRLGPTRAGSRRTERQKPPTPDMDIDFWHRPDYAVSGFTEFVIA